MKYLRPMVFEGHNVAAYFIPALRISWKRYEKKNNYCQVWGSNPRTLTSIRA